MSAHAKYQEQQQILLTEDDFVHINVSGMTYETLTSTLERFPSTLLGNPETRKRYYVKCKNAYFFDRHRACFEAILYFYQSGGLLIKPNNIPMHLFAEEISFFCLDNDKLLELQKDEGYIPDEEDQKGCSNLPKSSFQWKVWEIFEYPDSSFAARVLATWSILVISLSIFVFCMENMPAFQPQASSRKQMRMVGCVTNMSVAVHNETNKTFVVEQSDGGSYSHPWFGLELSCVVWFTIEYIIRLVSSPDKLQFMKSILNIIDLLAVLPYFVILPIKTVHSTPLSVLRVARLVRVFRIFKLSRHSLGLQILGHTLKASVRELGMLIFFLFLGVVLFSSAIFYAEKDSNSAMFNSMTDAFWYSLVTMTTVGYGDKVPKTPMGKLVGSLCAISGVLTIALPVPVIVSNFEFFYKRDRLNSIKRKTTRVSIHLDPLREELLNMTSYNKGRIV